MRSLIQHTHGALIVLMILFSLTVTAQEMVRDGHFEDSYEWIVYDMGSNDSSYVEFNYTEDTPAFGDSGCLRIYGGPSDYTNILVYQELDLIAGTEYVVSAAFKDLTGDSLPEPEGFWCQIYISEEEPVEGVDWKPIDESNSDIYLGFNSWSGCSGSGVDGTFQADACDGKNDTLFVAPGDPGESVLIFIGIKTGVWGSQLSYNVAIDNLSLKVHDATNVEQRSNSIISDFRLQQNYPNPFNAGTVLSYSIPVGMSDTNVRLDIFDLHGRLVKTLVDDKVSSGRHTVQWDGRDNSERSVTSGTYFARLSAGTQQHAIKLTSLK